MSKVACIETCAEKHLDFLARIHKYVSSYQRGIITHSELIRAFFQALGEEEADERDVLLGYKALPNDVQEQLESEIDLLAANDYYRRWFYIGDVRMEEEVHQDALRMQPFYRRVCEQLQDLLCK